MLMLVWQTFQVSGMLLLILQFVVAVAFYPSLELVWSGVGSWSITCLGIACALTKMDGHTAEKPPDQEMLLGDVENGVGHAAEQEESGHTYWSWECVWAEIL